MEEKQPSISDIEEYAERQLLAAIEMNETPNQGFYAQSLKILKESPTFWEAFSRGVEHLCQQEGHEHV